MAGPRRGERCACVNIAPGTINAERNICEQQWRMRIIAYASKRLPVRALETHAQQAPLVRIIGQRHHHVAAEVKTGIKVPLRDGIGVEHAYVLEPM